MVKRIKELIDFIRVIRFVMRNHSYSSPLNIKNQKEKNGKAIVLCNGPSLKDSLPTMEEGENYVVVNYFGLDENFLRLKPKYYCLADGMFFYFGEGNKFKERIDALSDLLNNPQKVDWPLTIYVPIYRLESFRKRFNIVNDNITVVGVNTIDVNTEKYRLYFYKKGWACPIVQTVANLAIYVLINMGYKHIELYGVDHTFTDGLCVDDNNVVCHTFRHYYSDESKLVPAENFLGERPTLSEELATLVETFRSHEKLENYSKSVGCTIINKTKGSMIDSYQRG